MSYYLLVEHLIKEHAKGYRDEKQTLDGFFAELRNAVEQELELTPLAERMKDYDDYDDWNDWTMQERNMYKNVPIAIVRRFVRNRLKDADHQAVCRAYEYITGNTTINYTDSKKNCVNILVNKEHDWKWNK